MLQMLAQLITGEGGMPVAMVTDACCSLAVTTCTTWASNVTRHIMLKDQKDQMAMQEEGERQWEW